MGQGELVSVLQSSPDIVTGRGSGLQGHLLQQPFDYHTTISILTSAKMFTCRSELSKHSLPLAPHPATSAPVHASHPANVFADSEM